jgi:hypothetical protein
MADNPPKYAVPRNAPDARRAAHEKVQAEAHAAFRMRTNDAPSEEQAAHAATRANTQRLRELRMARDAAAARARATEVARKKRAKAARKSAD